MGKARLIVSLDFELFWGMLDVTTLDAYREHILGGREAIPGLLELFGKYGIHATWATVGFLFGEGPEALGEYLPERGPSYSDPALDGYARLRDMKPEDRDCFFAPELIARIAAAPGQEIGSHTFCHYYCREAGQTPEEFRMDMRAAREIGQARGYDLRSVVLPRNQCREEYTRVLSELGFTAYRDEENDWIHRKIHFRPLKRLLRLADVYVPLTGWGGYEPKVEQGIVNLTGSRMYKPYFRPLGFLEGLKMRRIKAQMRHAAKKGLTFHLWWHPHNVGVRTDFHMRQLEEIFVYYQQLQREYGMVSQNMGEAAREVLEGRNN
ncbi:MAG: polysaccharide deacetylase family protein [Candidatus Faecousia sp.]|nr:polysaccharide deacetylase family protein [Candidatus Faecousia sp.]